MILRLVWSACAILALQCANAAEEPLVTAGELPRLPPTPPEKALDTFRLKPGFRLDLVAAEPLVNDPIALSFDESGRLFVLEMRDYSERRPERLGRVRRLVDTDGDGDFDQASVYVDGLPWPTALCCYDGGVFVGATPDLLFCQDTDDDGVADTRQVIFTGFASQFAPYQTNRLNVQAMLNNLTWGLDNRIHGSASYSAGEVSCPLRPDVPPVNLRGYDFSFDPRTYDLRRESGGGQHGLTFDSAGRKFVCSNSSHCRLVTYEARYAQTNPLHPLPPPSINIASDGEAAAVYRLSPDEPWRVIRTRWRVAGLVSGPVEGGGRPSGYFTAATGITIYRGGLLPYEQDVFVADCGSNLIHHKNLRPEGAVLRAVRPSDEQTVEFLASTDNWFRPVQLANGPEGALYIADMYREIIEHPWSLPDSIKHHLDLNSGNDRGRIYRVVPSGFHQPAPIRLAQATIPELVERLAHPNGWHRDTASRLLFQRQDRAAIPALEQLLNSATNATARLHALYALAGLEALKPEHLRRARHDADETVRLHAVRLSEQINSAALELSELANDESPRVRYQLAFTVGLLKPPDRLALLKSIAIASDADPWLRLATIHAAGDSSLELLLALAKDTAFPNRDSSSTWLKELAATIGADDNSARRLLDHFQDPALAPALPDLAAGLGEGLKRRGSTLSNLEANDALNGIFTRAMGRASDSNEPFANRAGAIRLLALAQTPAAFNTLARLLQPPGALAQETLLALRSFETPELAAVILEAWPLLTPPARVQAVDTLLVRAERAEALLNAISSGTLRSSDLESRQQQFLLHHPNESLRRRAETILKSATASTRDQVLTEFMPALRMRGTASRGQAIFQTRCSSCHRLGQEGHALGPDLTAVRAAGWEKILGQILDPNREVAPSYVSYTVETRDGETYSGLIASETETTLTLRQANGSEIILTRSNLASLRSDGLSLMPTGLESGLAPQDMADLLQFLAPQ